MLNERCHSGRRRPSNFYVQLTKFSTPRRSHVDASEEIDSCNTSDITSGSIVVYDNPALALVTSVHEPPMIVPHILYPAWAAVIRVVY